MEIDRLKPGAFGLVWEHTRCVRWRDNTPYERHQASEVIADIKHMKSKNRIVGIVRFKRWKDTDRDA